MIDKTSHSLITSFISKTKDLIKKYHLNISGVNINVKPKKDFRYVGLSSFDNGICEKTIELIKNAKDFAKAVGADKVTCCPLCDGLRI